VYLNPDYPRIDLHRHLEGSIRLETVLQGKHGTASLEDLRRQVWMTAPLPDILQIMPRFDVLRSILVDLEVCHRVTMEVLEDAAAEGLNYAEIRFSPLFMAEPYRLDPFSVTAVVCEAWQEAGRRPGFSSTLTVILSRTYGPDACQVELEAALRFAGRGVTGLDLAGDEARQPAGLFREHFSKARQAGLHLTAHAGEFAGAASVWETLHQLEPERLGHAVHAVDDPRLMEELARRGTAVECCPTSNLLTAAVPSLAAHPLPAFLQAGICATLNTDDPALFSGITLEHEYALAAREMGLSQADLIRVQENSLRAAFSEVHKPGISG
jgi:adenosine deaminase